ncbi:cardiotrophin-like cytokine factor 1 isoform X2 [Lepus europaeus]|uniref:cardiotrophin-like cytokine factor 1 isoform X2 n=1 Tax=Lepus europaeus TaxID=9983 RepID=UPI002B4A4D16|nr:cardiotrophin-like cytokine factor 1 isoform X2 [Lepus europaeus]
MRGGGSPGCRWGQGGEEPPQQSACPVACTPEEQGPCDRCHHCSQAASAPENPDWPAGPLQRSPLCPVLRETFPTTAVLSPRRLLTLSRPSTSAALVLILAQSGDSWGMLACLCTVLWHLPAVPALNRTGDPGPGPSIQKTYDLTRYLEHQLRSLAGTYLNYLGPPFNEPDFNPPRLGAETLPRATVNLEVWRSLNDKLRLTQNYEAYSHLLCYLRGLNRQAATAELRRSLAHFCTSLQGLLGSIAGVMAALGYPLPQPLPGTEPAWAPGPAHSDFLQKMDDFWLLKELQTWLWRSAKDFNRLKKKVQPPAAAVTLHLEAHGF